MIGLRGSRLEDLKGVLYDAYELGVPTKLSRIEAPHPRKGRGDIVTIKPSLMPPTEAAQELIKRFVAEVSFGESQQLSSAGETSGLGGMPPEMG
jgi:hypothetical protein